MTDRQLRDKLLEKYLRVRISRDGRIDVYTEQIRGDGGPHGPWWMFLGWRNQVVDELEGRFK